jgi:AcrR family transcriptional regulator
VAARRTSYHHGDLRDALVKAAVELVEERGPDGFTLREAARKVGVTHTAPYRHFADRDALLVAVAVEGFQGLHAAMRTRQEQQTDPRLRLQAIGIGYVEYAVAHPSHFRVMHSAVVDSCTEPGYTDAKGRTFQLLLSAIAACQQAGFIPPGPLHHYALTAWSAVHGLAELLMSGAAFRVGLVDGTATAAAAQVTRTLLDGLAGGRGASNPPPI